MHHVALDRTWPHDRHLDHQIVEVFWLQTRQHCHLRAAFYLKYAKRIRAAQHAVNGGVFGRNGSKRVPLAVMLVDQIKRLAQARQHAEAEHVDFQDTKRIEIVLVPFDESAVVHRRITNRHDFVESTAGNDESTDMLGKMARETGDLLLERNDLAHTPALRIEAGSGHGVLRDCTTTAAPDRRRQGANGILA